MEEFIMKSSGNVYQDLGFDDAPSMQIKAELVSRLNDIMEEKNLTQSKVAAITGIPQGRISKILRGHFEGVSEYKLLECLSKLGNDIEIRMTPVSQREGRIIFA